MDRRLDRLLGWARGEPQPPTKIEFFPTFECPSNCIFCHRRAFPDLGWFRSLGELSTEESLRLVQESAQFGVLEWHLIGGGEPLAGGPKTAQIMAAIKHHGMYGYLNTNGQLFTPELITMLVTAQWDYIKISLHGPDAASHDLMTGVPGSFELVTKALRAFKQEKARLGLATPRLEIGPVLNRLNYQRLGELMQVAIELGVDEFRPQALTVYHEDCASLRLDDADRATLDEQVDLVTALAQEHGLVTNIQDFRRFELVQKSNAMNEVILASQHPDQEHPFIRVPCYEPFYHLTIHSWGKVGVCGFTDMEQCVPLQGRRLADIWYGEEFQKVRAAMIHGDLPSYCDHCVSVLVMQNATIRDQLRQRLAAGLTADLEVASPKRGLIGHLTSYGRKLRSRISR